MRSGRLIRAIPVAIIVAALAALPALVAISQAPAGPKYGPGILPLAATGVPRSVGLGAEHVFIGHTLPPRPRAKQGSGPWPDTNLTPNTAESHERDPAAASIAAMNRIAIASNGVDEDEDQRIDPQLPTTPGFTPNYNIWLMRPDGSECVQITDLPGDEIEPAWDPGARWIAFAYRPTPSDDWDIYMINLNTREVRQIVATPANERHPTFAPDGNWIAYQCDANGNWDIYKVPVTGGAPVQLTSSPDDETDPAWAPIHGKIAYTGVALGHKRIFVMNEDGTNQQVVSNGGGDIAADDVEPTWLWMQMGAIDVLDIVFASNRLYPLGLDTTREYNIFRMGENGEAGGAPATLLSNKDPNDTADDRNPTTTRELQRAPIRICFQSDRAQAGNWDVWALFINDVDPPELVKLPWVSQREVPAGSDITIYAEVRDWDTGVQRVVALIKDAEPIDPRRGAVPPNNFDLFTPWFYNWSGHDSDFDSNVTGYRWLEANYPVIAQVELFDDGNPANGDAQAGDGIFSGVYTTQTREHDYVIDIYVIDQAGNEVIYDDVYGFTTRPFTPQHNVLFVNDYCEGQSFLAVLGYNNDAAAAFPVESYYLFNPSGTDPYGTEVAPNRGPANEWYDTIKGYYGEEYDVWRIICRGPVPAWVYQYYLPTVEYQLDPQEALSDPENAQATRRVLVADRAIIWASPHAGNLWVADGSIIDATTQADLALFLERGGRLFITGEDIAWALTMNGTVPNNFLAQYLRARFVQDTPVLAGTYPLSGVYVLPGTFNAVGVMRNVGYGFNPVGSGGDPVTGDPWTGTGTHEQFLAGADNPTDLDTPVLDPNGPDFTDAAEFSFRPDIIEPQAGAIQIYGEGAADGPCLGLRYVDAQTGARVVYLSFGLEQVHRGYSSNPVRCLNRRAALVHNVLCWLRTGGFQGRVLGIDGKPITNPNPIVYCFTGSGANRQCVAAVRCQDDGRYTIQGLPPGFYTLEARRPGYSIDHYEGNLTHGGLGLTTVDFVIKVEEAGAIFGLVTSAATGDAVSGATVTVRPVETDGEVPPMPSGATPDGTSWYMETTTAPDGSYKFGDLPEWDYEVTADGSAVGYGTAGPFRVHVTAGDTTRLDIQLQAADGFIAATVLNQDNNQPIPDAVVYVKLGTRVVAYGQTDHSGQVTIGVQPGTYDVTASAAGFGESAPQAVQVQSQQTTNVVIYLQPQPPGKIYGQVLSAVTGEPVGGIVVKLLVHNVEIDSTTTLPTLQQDVAGGPQYNFKFDPAPAGNLIVRPEPEAFTSDPTQIEVTVESNQVVSGLVFRLRSLHTFPPGLQLISIPGDNTALDPADIFGLAPSELRLAAWEASTQQYALYPQAPADRIRPGVGYWLYLRRAQDQARRGTAAPDPTTIQVYGVAPGPGQQPQAWWNLVGCPFEAPVDVNSITVRDRNGQLMSWQEARVRRKIMSSLWAYVVGGYQMSTVLAPYVGYWLAVSEPLELIVPNVGATQVSSKPAATEPRVEGGWLARIVVRAAGASDGSLWIGQAKGAGEGFDAGIDEPKPPAAQGVRVYAASEGPVGPMAVDVRRFGGRTAWRIHVQAPAGEEVEVAWPDLSRVPRDVRLVLVDEAAGKRVYMRTAAGYRFVSDGARTLEVRCEPAGQQLAVQVAGIQPARGGAVVRCMLSRPADLVVRIVNIAGRTVREIRMGYTEAGVAEVVWDGRNGAGSPVPAGRYLVVVEARAENGEQVRAMSVVKLER